MSTRKVRRDEHGLYVRINGSLFRPEVTLSSRQFDPTINDTVSRFTNGDYVDASIIIDTPFAQVDNEVWHDHGESYWFDEQQQRTRQIDSKHLWEPMSRGPLTEELLRNTLKDAKAISWDGCHKIYVLMDEEQVALSKSYGYGKRDPQDHDSQLKRVTPTTTGIETAYQTIIKWLEKSCPLSFINGIRTDQFGNEDFFDILPQGEPWVDEVYAPV